MLVRAVSRVGWSACDEYVAPVPVVGRLRLKAYFAQQPYPLGLREESMDVLFMRDVRSLPVSP